MRKPLLLSTMFTTIILSGCDMFGGPSADIPDAELRQKWRECKSISNPSRTKVLACENYERECERRKSKGNIACY